MIEPFDPVTNWQKAVEVQRRAEAEHMQEHGGLSTGCCSDHCFRYRKAVEARNAAGIAAGMAAEALLKQRDKAIAEGERIATEAREREETRRAQAAHDALKLDGVTKERDRLALAVRKVLAFWEQVAPGWQRFTTEEDTPMVRALARSITALVGELPKEDGR